MSEIAAANINTLGRMSPKADVQPSEQLFVLTYGQLQDLITQATKEIIQPLQDRISTLEGIIAHQEKAIATLKDTEAALKEHHIFSMVSRVEDLWAWVEELDKRTEIKPQPLQRDRADILRALLVANGGKLFAKEARKKMHLSKNRFSELLKVCDFIETKPYHLDKRLTVIILKNKLVPRNLELI